MSQSPVRAIEKEDVNLLKTILSESAFYGQQELSQALRLAADKGYKDCAEVLLEYGAMPDIHDRQGFTALMIACRKGWADIVKVLLSHHCKIDKPGFGIRPTAAHLAASYGHTQCLGLLVQAGGNIEVKTANGLTPLMMASRSGYEDCVELLLKKGADLNMSDWSRYTALHYASQEGNTDSARLLCRAGADINKKDLTGTTPLLSAAKSGRVHMLKLLTRNINVNMDIVSKELSVLHWAASSGSPECVQFLLDHGHSVNIETTKSYTGHDYIFHKGLTPLMMACIHGHREVVRLCIKHGADINKVDTEGYTPLTHAIHKGHPDCVLELIRKGATIESENPDEGSDSSTMQRPLFIAIKKSIDSLKMLLRVGVKMTDSKGPVLTSGDNKPITALELALRSPFPGVTCRMLLATGYKLTLIAQPLLFQELMAILAQVDEDLFCFITETAIDVYSIPPLFVLCRNKVRLILGRKVLSHLDDLPLPTKLKDTIYLKELDDFEKYRNYPSLMT